MSNALIDRFDTFAERYRLPISAISAGWFALTCADYAGFVSLPRLNLLTGLPGLILGGIVNALWWGVAFPRVQRRRAERAQIAGKIDG